MNVWQDDQALFFKLAHIMEPAGFFGSGPFGSGPYRFAATPFIPIYQVFKFNTYAYFSFLFILYAVTSIIIFKTFKFILNDKAGKIAGFIFAAGYITSDGFYRMANSVTTSVSIILACAILYFYWKYYKQKKWLWYFFALFFYFISLEITVSRMHYFFAVIFSFELIFLSFQKGVKSLVFTVIRLIPFFFLFYYFLISGVDPRVARSGSFFSAYLSNQYYEYYGFLASLTNLIIPDWILIPLSKSLNLVSLTVNLTLSRIYILFEITIISAIFFIIFRRKKILFILFEFSSLVWIYFSKKIFQVPLLHLSIQDLFIASLGGLILLLFLAIFLITKKYKQYFLFFILWMIGNIIAYSAYFPTVAYETTNRYLAHSFFIYAAILGLTFYIFNTKEGKSKYISYLIIVFAALNIYNSIVFQNIILRTRSLPTKSFFNQFQSLLPTINKGDIIYIDMAQKSQDIYQNAISAAMMPDTTAIAWRYGIDRYDFKLTNDFGELRSEVTQNNINPAKIYSFYLSSGRLFNTTNDLRDYFDKKVNVKTFQIEPLLYSNYSLTNTPSLNFIKQEDLKINLPSPIISIYPVVLKLTIQADYLKINDQNLPLSFSNTPPTDQIKKIWSDDQFRNESLNYNNFKENFYRSAKVTTSSEWKERKTSHLIDQDPTSVWQSDRILWEDKKSFLQLDLLDPIEVNRFIWINGFANNTPTKYTIESSLDGTTWVRLKTIENISRIENSDLQIVNFTSTNARFIRMTITDTVGGDSPSISEVLVVPSKLSELNINDAENYIKHPFLYINDSKTYNQILSSINWTGQAQLYFQNDKVDGFQTKSDSKINIIYDNLPHTYQVVMPAGGLKISSLKLSDFAIPGKVSIKSLQVEPLNYDESD